MCECHPDLLSSRDFLGVKGIGVKGTGHLTIGVKGTGHLTTCFVHKMG